MIRLRQLGKANLQSALASALAFGCSSDEAAVRYLLLTKSDNCPPQVAVKVGSQQPPLAFRSCAASQQVSPSLTERRDMKYKDRIRRRDFMKAGVMAMANVMGSLMGTRMALARGTGFVRSMFVLVVSLLILKTGWDAISHSWSHV